MTTPRFVLDTNVLVSAMLIEDSAPALAVRKAETEGEILYSRPMLSELAQVLSCLRLSAFISREHVEGLLARIRRSWQVVNIMHHVQACRDPKDDIFLELALNGEANALITGIGTCLR